MGADSGEEVLMVILAAQWLYIWGECQYFRYGLLKTSFTFNRFHTTFMDLLHVVILLTYKTATKFFWCLFEEQKTIMTPMEHILLKKQWDP